MFKKLISFLSFFFVLLYWYKDFLCDILNLNSFIISIMLLLIHLILILSFLVHKSHKILTISLFGFVFISIINILSGIFKGSILSQLLVPLSIAVLVIYYIIILLFKQLKNSINYFKKGSADKISLFLIISTIIISGIALILWFNFFKPNIPNLEKMLPTTNLALLILLGIVFAFFNSLTEELVWRGILWDALNISFKSPILIITIQAIGFGLIHLGGFPSGWVGVSLATIYGLFLGIIRYRTKGIFYPVLTHFFADLVIFFIIIFNILYHT